MELIESLVAARDGDVVARLVSARIETSESAMGSAIKLAEKFLQSLSPQAWKLFDSLLTVQDHRREEAQKILQDLKNALIADEHVVPLGETAEECQSRALRLLTSMVPPPPPPVLVPPPDVPIPPQIVMPPTPDSGTAQTKAGLSADTAIKELEKIQKSLKKGQTAKITISWTIE